MGKPAVAYSKRDQTPTPPHTRTRAHSQFSFGTRSQDHLLTQVNALKSQAKLSGKLGPSGHKMILETGKGEKVWTGLTSVWEKTCSHNWPASWVSRPDSERSKHFTLGSAVCLRHEERQKHRW